MNPFDKELRESLRRREPSAGFVARVMAQAEEPDRRPRAVIAWRWLAAASAVLVLTAGSLVYRRLQQWSEGERAKEQVIFALQVTGSELRGIQERLARMQQRVIEVPQQENMGEQ